MSQNIKIKFKNFLKNFASIVNKFFSIEFEYDCSKNLLDP